MRHLFLSFTLLLFAVLLQPIATHAAGFVCKEIPDPIDPNFGICVLDNSSTNYGCPNTPYYVQAANDWCTTNLTSVDCRGGSAVIDCSVIPTPTTQPNATPPPTPTTDPVTCVDQPCDQLLYIVCPGSNKCCVSDVNCPAPDTSLLPSCVHHGQCQIDWDGQGFIDGGSARVWDRYKDCSVSSCDVAGIPTDIASCFHDPANTVACSGALCDPGGGAKNSGVKTPFGCLPFTSGPNNEGAAKVTIETLSNWAIVIAGTIAIFIIIFASLQIATGSGDPKRIKAGQELLFSGLAGLFLISLAITLLNFLGVKILGLDLLGFII